MIECKHLRKHVSPSGVKGTPEFVHFFSSLDKESYLYRIIKEGLDTLKEDMFAGTKIQKKKFPKEYVEKYQINSLFKLNLDRRNRLTYTILAEGRDKIVIVIEFLDHKTFARRFGYRT